MIYDDHNKIINFVCLRNDINIKVSNLEPAEYMRKIAEYTGAFGSDISSDEQLRTNLSQSSIPFSLTTATHEDFFDFMDARRKLMSETVKEYYQTL